jgi:hypothetical protein
MESLYQPGKARILEWTEGTSAEVAGDKANELILPTGRTR